MGVKQADTVPLVSLIIPVYNAEAHLNHCMQSVKNQTLHNIQVIFVDDCSTDGSRNTICEYAVADKRIELVTHDVNQGEGAARNTGFTYAKGKYVMNMDPDDSLPENALELLSGHAERNCSEVVKGACLHINNDGHAKLARGSKPPNILINTNIHQSKYLQNIPTSHLTYLYNREFLENTGIKFSTEHKIGLDLVYLANVLVRADKVTLTPDVVYHYYLSEGSASRGVKSHKILIDGISAKRAIYEILCQYKLPVAALHYIQNWAWQATQYWPEMAQSHPTETCLDVFSEFRQALPTGIRPWRDGTKVDVCYLLSKLIAEKDIEAIDFLKSGQLAEENDNALDVPGMLSFVLSIFPDDRASLYALGRYYQLHKEPETALQYYDRAQLIDPTQLDLIINRAEVLLVLDRLSETRSQLQLVGDQLEALFPRGKYAKKAINLVFRVLTAETAKACRSSREPLDNLTAETDVVKQPINAGQTASDENESELVTVRSELENVSELLKTREREYQQAQHQLDAMKASLTWRLNRAINRVFARLFTR